MNSVTAAQIGCLVGAGLLAHLAYSDRRSAKEKTSGGRKVLRYGNGVKAFGWILCLATMPIVIFVFWSMWHTPSMQTSPLAIVPFLMTVAPLYLLVEFYRFRVEYDDTMIHVYSPWRRIRTIPWAELTTCVYWHYQFGGSYVVSTRGHGKLTLNDMLSGIDEFIALLKAKQSPDNYAASVLLNRPFWKRWGDIFRR